MRRLLVLVAAGCVQISSLALVAPSAFGAEDCGIFCPKPWAAPDRWLDADSNGVYNEDGGDNYDLSTTGYADSDIGSQITLILMNGNNTGFGVYDYYAVDFPPLNKGIPITGADQFENWICQNCLDSGFSLNPGDTLRVEPGKMISPNGAGLTCLIGLDPLAEWDASGDSVLNSDYEISPRIVKVPIFDPGIGLFSDGGGMAVQVATVLKLFIEQEVANVQIICRIVDVLLIDPDADDVLTGCDNCPTAYNPMQTDSDADGVGDACECNCPHQADFDTDGFRTSLDLASLIDVLFVGSVDIKDPFCPLARSDFDCDGFSTALDLAGLIDHLFAGQAGPCNPCAP